MNNKYKMYQNKIDKVFHNNKDVFIASNNRVYKNVDVRKKIDELINDSSFIYRMKVNIVIGNDIVSKKIVGIVNDKLLTIDNEQIPIDDIRDIYK